MADHDPNAHADHLSPEETRERVWSLAEDIRVCILTTWSGSEQHARPLTAHVARDEHALYFLVDESGHKNTEIEQYPAVSCSFVDKGSNDYVVIAGTAKLSNDREKIAAIWTNFAKAWWDDENDPSIRLLTVTPTRGEVWDGPGGLAAKAKIAFSAATGGDIDMGETGKARL
ncbi:pyridoxamine 5'-phosphate oxidase family protein [Pelagibacterium montanilacus]|uniref:pyridoxamine 5'-phosphate oxidase family protein n=1 Tax=Pelagibacterium montanilacus TaxID=2185280 RepID=UPI000F8EC82F|nr:pyridoxamine 5'-phosphate oxidase family protein [Pelagibacterium montanilacus]